jgi:tetratricopeptide (TPR) repeat protein
VKVATFLFLLLLISSQTPIARAQDTTATPDFRDSNKKGPIIDPLQKLHRHNKNGNQAFVDGELTAAMREYVEAQALSPNDSRVLYNLGNTLSRQGKTEDALSVLERAAVESREPALERDARFNRGVVQMEEEDLQAAVRSFGEALTVDPDDADARRNLELALRKLQEQQQDQQQDQQGDQEQNDQEQKQDQQNKDDQQKNQDENRDKQQENQNQRQDQQDKDDQQQEQQQNQPPPDAQREAARRLLKALENAEKQELKKAIQQKMPAARNRKEDW